jgi:metal-responsive CopG/Arc/MetJ family transcriptional regulator
MNYVQIVEICCRDLRRYLETALRTTYGGVVTVKMRRLLRAELSPPDRAKYSMCLSRVLHRWRWGKTYVIPRQDAEKLLETFDLLCVSAKNAKPRKETKPRRQKEELVFIAVSLPDDLLHAVDTYAYQHGVSRSAVVRNAIQELIEMRRALEELDKARDGQLRIVALRLPSDLLHALNERAAALKATRAAVVRYAIRQLLQRITAQT